MSDNAFEAMAMMGVPNELRRPAELDFTSLGINDFKLPKRLQGRLGNTWSYKVFGPSLEQAARRVREILIMNTAGPWSHYGLVKHVTVYFPTVRYKELGTLELMDLAGVDQDDKYRHKITMSMLEQPFSVLFHVLDKTTRLLEFDDLKQAEVFTRFLEKPEEMLMVPIVPFCKVYSEVDQRKGGATKVGLNVTTTQLNKKNELLAQLKKAGHALYDKEAYESHVLPKISPRVEPLAINVKFQVSGTEAILGFERLPMLIEREHKGSLRRLQCEALQSFLDSILEIIRLLSLMLDIDRVYEESEKSLDRLKKIGATFDEHLTNLIALVDKSPSKAREVASGKVTRSGKSIDSATKDIQKMAEKIEKARKECTGERVLKELRDNPLYEDYISGETKKRLILGRHLKNCVEKDPVDDSNIPRLLLEPLLDLWRKLRRIMSDRNKEFVQDLETIFRKSLEEFLKLKDSEDDVRMEQILASTKRKLLEDVNEVSERQVSECKKKFMKRKFKEAVSTTLKPILKPLAEDIWAKNRIRKQGRVYMRKRLQDACSGIASQVSKKFADLSKRLYNEMLLRSWDGMILNARRAVGYLKWFNKKNLKELHKPDNVSRYRQSERELAALAQSLLSLERTLQISDEEKAKIDHYASRSRLNHDQSPMSPAKRMRITENK